MAKKRTLRNVEAVHQMLKGEHKTQNKTLIGFSDANSAGEKQITRKPGEIWEEKDSTGKIICWWELTEGGTKIRHNVQPDIAKSMYEIRKYLRSFPNCPKDTCTCTVPTNTDLRFKRATGMCEDCTITNETRLKMRGEFNAYAIEKMRTRAESFFKDADVEIEKFKQLLRKTEFVSGDTGEVEKWSFDNVEEVVAKMDERYEQYKQTVTEKLQGQ